jgi:signal transduction histidine kinase
MESDSQDKGLISRAYWLIRLRWVATVCVGAGTWLCSNIFAIELQNFALYIIAAVLALYNTVMLLLLNHFAKEYTRASYKAVDRIINFQISADLLILTILLHFSGGIENPFVFYFMFHMIIASILLSERESYLQATFAVLIFGLMILLEYLQIIPHYCLRGFVTHCLYRDGLYVFGTFVVFATAMYLAVYMGSYIATRLKQAEQTISSANRLLLEKDRIKDEYVLRVTHDIKGHLAAIQSCLDVTVNGHSNLQSDARADFINRASIRTRQLTDFVRKLLKLMQLRLNSELEKTIFPLQDAISNAAQAVKSKAQDKSIILNIDMGQLTNEVIGDQLSVEEAITNLLLNAIKYTPAGGKVAINAKEDGDHVLVEVIDTGIGIPQKELPKIFDEFYRATNARKIEKDGTGLGLSIVKQIVERNGGKIYVESEENNGTRILFILLNAADKPAAERVSD